jgi:phosphoribosyl-ATP pyrophosphohydrolase/phosphoribosyl-AMP cyclohydrolase
VVGAVENAPDRHRLAFGPDGLVPAVVQEARTGEVLMVAWMNADALARTLATGSAHFWSRSRQALWQKGETSGHVQHVEALYADCDRDAVLVLVHQEGVACHTGRRSCFFDRLDSRSGEAASTWEGAAGILGTLERLIQSRKAAPRAGSYVSRLLECGDALVLKKVGEEAAEVIVAAVSETPARLVSEVADLWFHTLVLLGARGIPVGQVLGELAARHRARGAASPDTAGGEGGR